MMSQREGLALLYGQKVQFPADAATNFQVSSICGWRGARVAGLGEAGLKIFSRKLKNHVELRPIQPADEECVCSLSVRSKYATRGTTERQKPMGLVRLAEQSRGIWQQDGVLALAFDLGYLWSRE
jgi:hypothetical protein